MTMRDKDSADFDLEKFVDLFDTAMSSDNPVVKRALRNLLMIAAMVDAESPSVSAGPLRRLVEDIKNLNNRISTMESKQSWPPPAWPYNNPGTGTPSVPAGPYPYTGPFPYTTTTTTTPGQFPPNTIVGGGSVTTGYAAVNSGAVSGDISANYASTTAYDHQWAPDKTQYYNALLDNLEAKGPLT
jgi:hypothetical protein